MNRSPATPSTIGPYRVLEELGRGGMGVVYRALEPSLGREVAIKVLVAEGEARRERLTREGELTAALTHPGIVKVHGAGLLPDGQPYLVYELIGGAQTLAEALPALSLAERVARVRDAARALGHAHARGVVHRDVKPENLLIGADGALKVADFGLAVASDLERLTQSGAVVGTPAYMAPEMLYGRKGEVGPPCDVWALGVLLYQALAERLPFDEETYAALAAAITSAAPASLPREVPADLAAVCARALAKRPVDRYAHGDGLADELDAWLAGRSPRAARAARLRRAARGALLVGGLAAIGATLAVAGAGDGAGELPSTARQAPSPTAAPVDEDHDPRAAWAAVVALEDRVARASACRRWLARYGTTPLAEPARAHLRELAAAPLLTLGSRALAEPAYVEVAFTRDRIAYVAASGRVGGGALSAWAAPWDSPRVRLLLKEIVSESPLAGLHPRGSDCLVVGLREVALLEEGATRPGARWRSGGWHSVSASSPDGELLVVVRDWLGNNRVRLRRELPADLRPRLVVLRTDTLDVAAELRWNDDSVFSSLAFTADGRHLVAASYPRLGLGRTALACWSARTWLSANRIDRTGPALSAITTLPGRPDSLAMGNVLGELQLVKVPDLAVGLALVDPDAVPMFEAQQLGREAVAHEQPILAVAAPADGRVLYSAAAGYSRELVGGRRPLQGSVAVWDLVTRQKARSLGEDQPAPNALAVSPDGGLLLVGHVDGTASLWVGGLLD